MWRCQECPAAGDGGMAEQAAHARTVHYCAGCGGTGRVLVVPPLRDCEPPRDGPCPDCQGGGLRSLQCGDPDCPCDCGGRW